MLRTVKYEWIEENWALNKNNIGNNHGENPKILLLGLQWSNNNKRERERYIEREIGQTASQRGMDGCNIEEFPVIWRFNLIQAMYTESKFTIKLVGAIKGWIVYRSITTLSQSTSEVIYKLISYAVSD